MLTNKFQENLPAMIAGVLLIISAVVTIPVVLAQDDMTGFEAYIYAGSIEDMEGAEVIGNIGDLERETDMDENREHWSLLGAGQEMPDELYSEDEDMEDGMTMEQLLAEPHLIVIHEGDDTQSAITAVGIIRGTADENGGILIQIEEHEDSGFEGRVWIGPDPDNDDDEIDLVVGVFPVGSVEPLATPGATPAN